MGKQNHFRSASIEPGQQVYDNDGQPVGRVSGFTDNGFEAEVIGPEGSDAEELPGKEFGEGYLMWRCVECGEMDELAEGIPKSCPDCGAPAEAISFVEED